MLRRIVKFLVVIVLAALAGSEFAFANDNFSARITVSGASGSTTGNNSTGWTGTGGRATGESGEPTTYSGTGELNTLWYTWTAPGNGSVTFETCSNTTTTFDTTLQSFTGSAVNALTLLATNDDTTGCATTGSTGLGSRITWNVTSGTAYQIQVDGYNSNRGAFRLAWNFTGFTIVKSASASSISAPGTITYTITIDNTGNVNLTGPSITDALLLDASARTLTSGPTLTSGDSDSDGQVDTTEVWTYTATYSVPQSDIDIGGTYSNTATFDTAQTIAYTSGAATTSITQSPSFTNVKSLFSGPSPVTGAGQTLTYRLTIANTGNVTLTGPTVVSDTFQLGGSARTITGPSYTSGDANSDGRIDVGETWIYTATYVTTQADLDATGDFTNVADFDTTQTSPVTSNTVTTNVTRTPSFTISKTQSSGPNPVTAAGQAIGYTITVANTGNQTLTSPVASDTLLQAGSPRTIAAPTYSSGDANSNGNIDLTETWIYTTSYTVLQSDIDDGGTFSNTATFTSTQAGPTTSAAVTTPVTQTKTIAITKSWLFANPGDDANSNGIVDAGDVLTFRFDVQNTGNVTLTNVTVADGPFSGSGPTPVPDNETLNSDVAPLSDSTDAVSANQLWSSLGPQDTVRFIDTYLVTQTDIDNQ